MKQGEQSNRSVFAEVLLLALGYYFWVKLFAFALADVRLFNGVFSGLHNELASGFARGVLAQLSFLAVLAFVVRNQAVLDALRSLAGKATGKGWTLALAASSIDALVLSLWWIHDAPRIFEVSFFNLSLSLIPAADGFSQEVFFRGYVILRLAKAGFSRLTQVLTSGLLFGGMHLDWGFLIKEPSLLDVLSPFLGTFALGCVYAVAFQASKYRLLPVVVAHALLIAVIQPWLALSYILPR